MGSASVAEEQSENSMSNIVLHSSDQVSLDLGTQSVKSVQPSDQFTSGDDYNPKARKPYTITKQRERWTEEEHNKFLEALKLYGRAWKRIEEHVGTKTAVQIRSHAQKFFTKVVRESNGVEATEVKPIEIPPPRPKRKPMHPYPRKSTSPNKSGHHLCEQPPRSTSPNSSISDQENGSPTSVLSAVCSDGGESCWRNGGSSPVPSAADLKPSVFLPSDDMSPDENGLSSFVQNQDSSTPDEQVPVKMEMFQEDKAFVKEGSPDVASTQSLKLFGKTVLVSNSHKPSSPSNGTCKPHLMDASEIRPVQALPLNILPVEFTPSNTECSWSDLPCGPPVYYMQFPSENSDLIPAVACSIPWWNSYGGLSFPFPQPQNQEAQEKEELRKEGSLTGSNTGSGHLDGENDKNWDIDTQSGQNSLEKEGNEQKTPFLFKQSERSAFSGLRLKGGKCEKGFVPYKRCLAERDNHSSIAGEERDEQRVRLCL